MREMITSLQQKKLSGPKLMIDVKRVEDKIKWAKEFLEEYGYKVDN
jgi:D-serine deaminase-like pyridoxal phosphate-dependent protein